MRTTFKAKANFYAFDSLREFGTWLADTPRNWPSNRSRENGAQQSWDLNCGYDKALELARKGWIDGAQVAQRKLKTLAAKQPAPQERNDFYGYRPNVPRYCAGAPDNMVRHEKSQGAGKSLVLYVSINGNYDQKADCMSNYGVAVSQYVKQLELEGTRCEVHCVATTELRPAMIRQTFSVCVKRAGQPLDLAVLAFAIGHPAMLRRLEFAFCERAKGPYDSAYGVARDTLPEDLQGAPSGAVIVNGMGRANSIATTPERALEALTKEIDSKRKG